jgi:transcriptional regulator with XRE-family HTH domain
MMAKTNASPTEQQHAQELRKAFGQRIKELRKQRRWTQKDLAGQVGVPFSVLNKYESGINVPPIEKLIAVAEALQTSVDYLLTGNEADTNPIYSNRIIERLKAIQEFTQEEQETALSLLDALILKHEVSGRVSRFEC